VYADNSVDCCCNAALAAYDPKYTCRYVLYSTMTPDKPERACQ
jgi:hypothetical protein